MDEPVTLAGASTGVLKDLRFAVKDLYDVRLSYLTCSREVHYAGVSEAGAESGGVLGL